MAEKKSKIIFQKIIRDIEQNKYKADSLLPSEDEFCKTYNASRSVVREALQALNIIGLIDIRPGVGTFLEKITLNKIFNPINITFSPDKENLIDLLEFRMVFEKLILELVLNKINDIDIQKLQNILDLTKYYFDRNDSKMVNELDYKFHEALVKISNNKIISSVFDFIYPYIKLAIIKNVRGRVDQNETIESHQKILNSIKSKDLKNTMEALKDHLLYTKKVYDILSNKEHHNLQDDSIQDTD